MPDDRVEELKRLLPRCFLPDWVRLGSRLVRLWQDRRHPEAHDAVLNRLLEQARASAAFCERRQEQLPRVSYPAELPITSRAEDIVRAIRENQVVVLAGETGSGKTTQVPKMCLQAGLGVRARIACTQPRRVAALSISRRLAEELEVGWGREVGCKIRFDDRSHRDTYIKMMTDGILLAETQGDPLLSEYDAIIIDEAHERSLNIDFLLGYLKGLLAKRKDLKLIVTSATIDTQRFSEAFGGAPIIEVSGRLYPVEVVYRPMQEESQERGDMTYVDAAVAAVDWVGEQPGGGDILIFMPGERDIRETCDLLAGRHGGGSEIIPLFGRLTSGEQQRVFAGGSRRKIVVATNIAETSLTIPGIRYVIDTGLARISRYNPRTRTRRLPVEPIAQSSALQRQGRCGRVRNGVCVRLYSEEDFSGRAMFAQPEIQRSNLAEVILRMKAFRLGDIETFPFIDPPAPASVRGGYQLLQELGALDEGRELTDLGRELARWPIDPTLGRMLWQAQEERATRELLIIAAGLSIQDPRERPLDKAEAADSAHRRFLHPTSDFLTLLNLWHGFHDAWESLSTQNKRRKFCRANFLSYTRMREWQDLHAQLEGALKESGRVRWNEGQPDERAVHRSILAGLVGHVARRTEANTYQAAGNRQWRVFPGSVLFDRQAKRKKGRKDEGKNEKGVGRASFQPAWLMAGEIVETTQPYARTLAGVDPKWILELAPHVCKFSYQEPHWDVNAGRVLVQERVTVNGLEIHRGRVAYGPKAPKEATEIFIRAALVEGGLLPAHDEEVGARDQRHAYDFWEHNRRLRQKVENWQTRTRHHAMADLDEVIFQFYAGRLENVSSRQELDRFMKSCPDPDRLYMSEEDLSEGRSLDYDREAFPDAVTLAGQPVALEYAYAPGEARDGVTVRLPWTLAETMAGSSLSWAVPGLREPQILELLRSLPKALRKQLMPFPPKVAEIAAEWHPAGESFTRELGQFIRRRYGVEIPEDAWQPGVLPAHLRPRVQVVDDRGQTVAEGRDWDRIREQCQATAEKAPEENVRNDAWERLAQKWERFDVTTWSFGELPERLTVDDAGALPIYAWPGLCEEEGVVSVRLFPSREAARRASLPGLQRLVELALGKELAWLQKDLRAMRSLDAVDLLGATPEEWQAEAWDHLRRHVLPQTDLTRWEASCFRAAVDESRERLSGLALKFLDLMKEIVRQHRMWRQAASDTGPGQTGEPEKVKPKALHDWSQLEAAWHKADASKEPSQATVSKEVDDAPWAPGFLRWTSFEQLRHLPRYLQAARIRRERARLQPQKDQERAAKLAPYLDELAKLRARSGQSFEAREKYEAFRWMIEEYKVSLFAQELGTDGPISPKRLDAFLRS